QVRRELGRQRGGRRRQLDRDRRSALEALALGPAAAAVELDQIAHDAQAETEAAVAARRRAIRLPESIEDVRKEVGLDAGAVVLHDQREQALGALEPHVDVAVLRSELD